MELKNKYIISPEELVLITGANGFIGTRLVECFIRHGFKNIRCFIRPSSDTKHLQEVVKNSGCDGVHFCPGNLNVKADCERVAKNVSLACHLAAGSDKSYSGSFLDTVVTTRNLLDGLINSGKLKRFVNVSSFAVYTNWNLAHYKTLDETCELEPNLIRRGDAYCNAKMWQESIVREYNKKFNIPFTIVRPGSVYGPRARQRISPRIGIDTFGVFMNLANSKHIPLTYVDNCAEAIMLAGVIPGVDGEVFNLVDDELPTGKQFLKLYKQNVAKFTSVRIPYPVFYLFCWIWEKYSAWSHGQLPPAFNRYRACVYYKGNKYSNAKAKQLLGWQPRITFAEGSRMHFAYFKQIDEKKD